jgi:AAA+ ATPase superfamily predicted ATPase
MKTKIIGRELELAFLDEILETKSADLMTITGRRRVGKTFLVKSYFHSNIDFELTGILNASMKQQLQNFSYSLNKNTTRINKYPENWLEAFRLLFKKLEKNKSSKKKIIFIDEFPWLDTPKSNFIAAFDWFWNSWAVNQNVLVIICGSAATWIIKNIINNKGGLHNRVTKRLHLQPFNLKETELFLKSRKVNLSRFQIVQLYNAIGGIPHYLNEIKANESAMQNIQRICFDQQGLLVNEFNNLYKALFVNSELHEKIVFALAKKHKGLTRTEILNLTKISDGGTFTKTLIELELSGFISSLIPFQKTKKDTLYRLTDEYSLFYIKFMYKKKSVNWNQLSQTQSWKIWSGYAFENLCIKHETQIKKALGIASVYTEIGSFYSKGNATNKGTQIDMLINRNDGIINIVEIKFTDKPFTLTKNYAQELQQKLTLFQEYSDTKKTLFLTMITAFGMPENNNYTGFIQQQLSLENLFD